MWNPEVGHYSRVHQFDSQNANFSYNISLFLPPSFSFSLSVFSALFMGVQTLKDVAF